MGEFQNGREWKFRRDENLPENAFVKFFYCVMVYSFCRSYRYETDFLRRQQLMHVKKKMENHIYNLYTTCNIVEKKTNPPMKRSLLPVKKKKLPPMR